MIAKIIYDQLKQEKKKKIIYNKTIILIHIDGIMYLMKKT